MILATSKPERSAAETAGELEAFGRFAVGYAVLWVVLTAMAERPTTRPLAVAFALSIAAVATVYYLPTAARNLGLAAEEGG